LRAEQARCFTDGTLSIDDLNYNEIKEHLVRLSVPGKERFGKKEELRVARGRQRTTRLERNERAQRKRQSDTFEHVKDTRGQHDN